MTKTAVFRDTICSPREAQPRSLGPLSGHRKTGSPMSLIPCPFLAWVSVLLAISPVSKLTLLLLLFLVLDIGVATLLGRDFCACRETKFVAIGSFPVSAGTEGDLR